ncbi:MAG: GC-type dockerin domain-anchored protein [Phycisphaerales bacterium]
MRHQLCFTLASICIGSATLSAAAGTPIPSSWTFELQCRSSLDSNIPAFNLPFPSSLSSQYVSIDDGGDVAIRTVLAGSEGIFYGQGGSGSVIITAPAPNDPVWSSSLVLRNGMIAIEMGSFGDGAQLWSTDGSIINNFAIGGSQGVSGFTGIGLTSTGKLCYRADSGAVDKIVTDEFVGPTRTQTLIAQTGTGDYSFLFSPTINDANQILANTIPGGSSRRIVRFEPDGSTTTIAQTGPVWNAFVNSTDLAPSGIVAFDARRNDGSIWEVLRWDDTGYTTIADGNHPDLRNGAIGNFPPVLNSDGWVAFRAGDSTHSSTSLWVGDGTDLYKLIEYDQLIDTDLGPIQLGYDFGGFDGKQVMNGVIDINEAGQIAFSAFLRNGTVGVFVATPNFDSCIADFNNDGTLDFFDISAFVSSFSAMDPQADLNNDGLFDFFDISAFVAAYAQGCQ